MVGVMSIAVPTIITSTMIATISSVGSVHEAAAAGRPPAPGCSATVISQALTTAAAIRNITTALVWAAPTNTPYSCVSFSSR